MQYVSPSANYQSNLTIDFAHTSDDYEEGRRNDYSRRQSFRALRKRARRKTSQNHPGPGMGGRRNRHYTW